MRKKRTLKKQDKATVKRHRRKRDTLGISVKTTSKKRGKRRGRKEGARPMAVGRRHFVYQIQKGKRWYTGLAPDWQHRLRQHNREIKGGANKTRPKKGDPPNSQWRVMCLLTAPIEWLDHHCGLQLEWIVDKARFMMKKQKHREYEDVAPIKVPGNARASVQMHSLLWMLHNKSPFTDECPIVFDKENPLHEIEIFLAQELYQNETLVNRLRGSKFWKPRVCLLNMETEPHLQCTPKPPKVQNKTKAKRKPTTKEEAAKTIE